MAVREPLIASCVGDKVVGDPSTLVPWWSIAKTAIAACALVLVAGGRLDLDRTMPGRSAAVRVRRRGRLSSRLGVAWSVARPAEGRRALHARRFYRCAPASAAARTDAPSSSGRGRVEGPAVADGGLWPWPDDGHRL